MKEEKSNAKDLDEISSNNIQVKADNDVSSILFKYSSFIIYKDK